MNSHVSFAMKKHTINQYSHLYICKKNMRTVLDTCSTFTNHNMTPARAFFTFNSFPLARALCDETGGFHPSWHWHAWGFPLSCSAAGWNRLLIIHIKLAKGHK